MLYSAKESPTITVKHISEMLSESQHAIKSAQKNGVLKHEGKDNDGMWVIVKNNVN